jgi:predicted DNA-binding transcriptional regulator YafY
MTTELSRQERIQRELAGELTGYDKLLEAKDANIKKLQQLLRENPNITRREVAEELGVSSRTVSRYNRVLKKIYKDLYIKNPTEKQEKHKQANITKLRKLVLTHPEYTRKQQAKVLGVSIRTFYKYLKEL